MASVSTAHKSTPEYQSGILYLNYGTFATILWTLFIIVIIVDLFAKIVDLLFKRVVLLTPEPPSYGLTLCL